VVTAVVRPVPVELTAPGYHYPDGMPALSEIHLAVAAGERMAVLGPNGAGKTTLLLHLAALLPERQRYLHRHTPGDRPHRHETTPRVTIDGIVVSRKTVGQVRERVGVVFHDPDDQLLGLTVEEDVAYGPRARTWPEAEVSAAVRDALSAVGLAGFASRTPHHLSAGEKRRVCLAGVLACRPGLLLLDEPSSGLDPRGRRELHELLDGFAATQVIASHDLDFVSRLCTRAVILERGAIAAQGAIGELLSDRALLRRHGLN
jgi:energy-coupling factor transporter ATP-binding protein EcfA2